MFAGRLKDREPKAAVAFGGEKTQDRRVVSRPASETRYFERVTLEFQVRNSRSENPDPRVALHERVQKMSRNKVSRLRYWPD